MASLITKLFSQQLAQNFLQMFDIGANSYLPQDRKTYVFAVLGKQTPWNSGTEVVPSPGQSEVNLIDYYDKGIVAKRMTLNDVSFVVPRYDWTANTVYTEYSSSAQPADDNFYVLNSKDQVFKCLFNNGGVPSTDQPEVVLSATSLEEPYFLTSDGYRWKYLYTINSIQKQKFLNTDWMPVVYNKFVRAAAINRSIDIVDITNAGNNYVDGSTQNIITVIGDGTGAILKANVSNGHIQNIIVQNRGKDYTKATATITDVAGGFGSNASISITLSPQNGHGYDPVVELHSNTIMLDVDFEGNEAGEFPADNEFRQIWLLKNPYDYGTATLASSEVYTLYTKITVSPGVGDFNNDEIIFQGETLDLATFRADVISFDEATNIMYINNISGSFTENVTLKGYNSGAIRVGVSLVQPEMQPYSGQILMAINQQPLTRDPDQTDRIKFILSF